MNFCPECDNLLYPTKNKLFCKFCGHFVNLRNDNIITKSEHKSIEKSNGPLNYQNFFPYEQFRPDQEKIIREIEASAKSRKNILLASPNGTGKTIIALSSLLPLVYEKKLKILYLCRTHSQTARVIKELEKISNFMKKSGFDKVKINGLSIRGRNEMCLHEYISSHKFSPRDAMSVCRDLRKNRTCKHFLNLIKKMGEFDKPILIAPELFEEPIDAEILINFCNQKKLCPYFLSKFLLEEMRVIVCNYQWIFNPFIRETFLKFIGRELQNCILVIDECHNVIDVATEVNSDRISPYSLQICLKDLEENRLPIKLQSFVRILMDNLNEKKSLLKVNEKAINAAAFLELIYKKLGLKDLSEFNNLVNELYEYGISIHEERMANGIISRDYLGSLAEFWLKWISSYSLDNYFFSYNIRKNKGKTEISLEIVALDPREISIPILKSCYTSLNLSGTVNPYVYNNLMGLNESGKTYKGMIAGSPFKKENIRAIITEGVNTKRDNRTPDMYQKMNEKINEVIYCTPGNVGIFCASYKILKGLYENELGSIVKTNKKKLFMEEPGLSASENSSMIEDFKSLSKYRNGGAVLLGVCGGRNSEGEDYPGDYMNSVVIAGFPYHMPTPRVQAKIEYYDKVFNKQGWNFGYLYPAIQRANQAGGRPIRKINDKGAIIFMDNRFKDKANWISDWIRRELEIIPDREKAITQHLYPFWFGE